MQRVVSLTANIHGRPLGFIAPKITAAVRDVGQLARPTVNIRGQILAQETIRSGWCPRTHGPVAGEATHPQPRGAVADVGAESLRRISQVRSPSAARPAARSTQRRQSAAGGPRRPAGSRGHCEGWQVGHERSSAPDPRDPVGRRGSGCRSAGMAAGRGGRPSAAGRGGGRPWSPARRGRG